MRISFWNLLASVIAILCLAGCLGSLKPAGIQTRQFLLTSPTVESRVPAGSATRPPAIGVGYVKMPAHLLQKNIVYRKETNEVVQIENAMWAERLDQGLQRVLAANLSALLATDQVRLSSWLPTEVNVEVHVTVVEFAVDETGRGVLKAWWRVLQTQANGGFKSGQFRAERVGPPPVKDTQGAVATLGELASELSQDLAEAINSLSP